MHTVMRILNEYIDIKRMPIMFFSTLEYGLETENLSLSAIRTIRVLRPLRAINRIPSKYFVFHFK